MRILPSKYNLAVPFVILILLNLGDAIMTSILVFGYGASVEVNPILQDLIQIYGVGALFGFKYFLISLLGILLLALRTERHKMVARYSLYVVNGIYACIVIYGAIIAIGTINI